MLETLGYKSKGIKNPKEAISFFKTNKDSKDKISAIICDLTIPGQMSGVETAAELRKIDKNIPIFVASGYSEDPVMTNPSEYGFTQSIPKPFKRTELAKLLDTNLPKD
jgi:CheY-like chemotaxis protein